MTTQPLPSRACGLSLPAMRIYIVGPIADHGPETPEIDSCLGRFPGSFCPLFLSSGTAPPSAQDARPFVQQAVTNELAKDEADHSHWLYFEDDKKADHPVRQWVAETTNGNLRRVIQIDGQALSPDEQRRRVEAYLADSSAQRKSRKGEQHDDKQATEMLEMLPKAFIWTNEGEKGRNTVLHFRPDPKLLILPISRAASSPLWKATCWLIPSSTASPASRES